MNKFFGCGNDLRRHPDARRQLDLGFERKLRFTMRVGDGHMRSWLFSGKEEQPKRAVAKHGWNHGRFLARNCTCLTVAVAAGLIFVVGCTRQAKDAPGIDFETPHSPNSLIEQIQAVQEGGSQRIEVEEPLADDEWEALEGLEGLEELVLAEGGLDDARAERLATLPALRKLVARNSPLTDAGFAVLATCGSLQELNVPQAACTAEGVAALSALPNLRSLRIGGGQLQGAEVCRAVVALPKLKFLHLVEIVIGDDGLAVLEQRPDLWSLYLDGAGVSDEAWGRYFHACPHVHVHVDQMHHDRDPGADHDEHASATSPTSSTELLRMRDILALIQASPSEVSR